MKPSAVILVVLGSATLLAQAARGVTLMEQKMSADKELRAGASRLLATDFENPLDSPRNQIRLTVLQITREAAIGLDFPGFKSSGVNAKANKLYFYAMLAAYREMHDPEESVAKYYGYGMRMLITVDGVEGALKADLPFIAATATTKNVETSLNFHVFGIDDVNALKLARPLVAVTKFDVDAYGMLLRTRDELIQAVTTEKVKIVPEVFSMPESVGIGTAPEKIAYVFAIRGIAARLSIDETVGKLANKPEGVGKIIAYSYKEVCGITRRSQKPTKKQAEHAAALLKEFGMN